MSLVRASMFGAIAVTGATALGGCGSNAHPSEAAPANSVARPTTKPATARPASKQRTDNLVGFGATGAAWDAHHQADSRFSAGAAYDPDPSLGRGDERYDDKYYAVGHDGRITNYEMRFPPQTTVAEAKASVLTSEFPPDAKIAWFKRLDSCAQMLVRSRIVYRATHGAALVEFSSGKAADRYDPSDVWSAILLPTEWAGPGSDFGC